MKAKDDAGRLRQKILLDNDIRTCRRCVGMNEAGVTQSAPGWGKLDSPVVILARACANNAWSRRSRSTRAAGTCSKRVLQWPDAKKPTCSSLTSCIATPGNRQSHPHEILNCSAYLFRELEIVRPQLVVGLGGDAKRILSFFYPTARQAVSPFSPPEKFRFRTVPCLYFTDHPSWVKRKHDDAFEAEWVNSLGEALKWVISKASLRSQPLPAPEPTCGGMVWTPVATEGEQWRT